MPDQIPINPSIAQPAPFRMNRVRLLSLLLVFAALLGSALTSAARIDLAPVKVGPDLPARMALGDHLRYLEDTTAALTVEDIIQNDTELDWQRGNESEMCTGYCRTGA